jgi:hypothetical protein
MSSFGWTVKVRRPAPEDRHGDPTGPPVDFLLSGVAIAPGDTRENTNGANTVTADATLYCRNPHADLTAADQVIDGDDVYEVVGRPDRWRNPDTGERPGIVAPLRYVQG